MQLLQRLSVGLARKTSRRGLFGRGAEVATGALLGVAAGTLTQPRSVSAHTGCGFPGPPCPCSACRATGSCGKPCVILTTFYASGCWVYLGETCCDCDCNGFENIGWCGCGSGYHNEAVHCPDGNADK